MTRPREHMGSPGGPGYEARRRIAARDGERCAYCLTPGSVEELVSDHVLPQSRGGPNGIHNRALACVDCDGDKRNRTPQEWVADLGFPGFVFGTPVVDQCGLPPSLPTRAELAHLIPERSPEDLVRVAAHQARRGQKKVKGSKPPPPPVLPIYERYREKVGKRVHVIYDRRSRYVKSRDRERPSLAVGS